MDIVEATLGLFEFQFGLLQPGLHSIVRRWIVLGLFFGFVWNLIVDLQSGIGCLLYFINGNYAAVVIVGIVLSQVEECPDLLFRLLGIQIASLN